MKIITIGDIHGRTNWKEKVKEDSEKIIFLGDYVDSFDISNEEIIKNLEEIIEFKKQNLEKVELLLGNHDLMYLFLNSRLFKCSGFRETYADEISRLFNQNKQLFKACYQITKSYADETTKRWLFSHAGLSRLFLKSLQKRISSDIIDIKGNDYATYINEIFNTIPNYLSDISFYRGGMADWGSIFWADMREFSKDSYIPELNQIVGHQPIKKIKEQQFGEEKTRMIWIDTESYHGETQESKYVLNL